MDDCIFCKIVKREAPASIVYESDTVIAFKSIQPVSETHILIVPKDHVYSVTDFSDANQFFSLLTAAQSIIADLQLEKGYKLVFNGGKYQAVPHAHWHLLGGTLEDKKDVLNNI